VPHPVGASNQKNTNSLVRQPSLLPFHYLSTPSHTLSLSNWLDYQEYSLTEFLADMILPQKSIDLLENVDWDAASKIPANKFHPSMSKSEVGKLLDIDPKQVDEAIDAGQEFVLPAGEHGGQGIIDFYGTKLLTKKNLNKLDVPLVKIKVDRPDGTFVEVDALDLGGLPDDPKKIPYSLYAIALANVGGVGKAVTEMNAEQQQQQTNNDNLQMAEGGFVNETDNLESMGNKPPVGALEEEVADNIDADLSEGEFVFPADVHLTHVSHFLQTLLSILTNLYNLLRVV